MVRSRHAACRSILLLCADKGGMSPQAIEQCRELFNKLKRETARQVIAFQQKRRASPLPGD